MKNKEIAVIFNTIGGMMELLGENSFRVSSYYRAARALEDLGEDIEDLCSRGHAKDVTGIGPADGAAPAIHAARPRNGSEHAYALVPGRLLLDRGRTGLVPGTGAGTGGGGGGGGGGGDTEIFSVDGKLWLRGGGVAPGSCRPVREGMAFQVAGLRVAVGKITQQDQK